jgi:hypothetical protein
MRWVTRERPKNDRVDCPRRLDASADGVLAGCRHEVDSARSS